MIETPKISVNKLAEYIEATPTRRRRIVIDQKEPSPFIVARYKRAREIAVEYFCNQLDPEIIVRGIEELELESPTTDFQKNDLDNSILFLENLLDIELPDFEELELSPYEGNNPKLNLKGLEISVYPDVIIRGKVSGSKIVGAIKIQTSLTNPLTTEGAKSVATLIHSFVQEHIVVKGEKAHLKNCLSIDVFARNVEYAPNSYKRRYTNLEHACSEILLWWDKL